MEHRLVTDRQTGRHRAIASTRGLQQTEAAALVGQTWNWVIGLPGQWVIWVIFHVQVTG